MTFCMMHLFRTKPRWVGEMNLPAASQSTKFQPAATKRVHMSLMPRGRTAVPARTTETESPSTEPGGGRPAASRSPMLVEWGLVAPRRRKGRRSWPPTAEMPAKPTQGGRQVQGRSGERARPPACTSRWWAGRWTSCDGPLAEECVADDAGDVARVEGRGPLLAEDAGDFAATRN